MENSAYSIWKNRRKYSANIAEKMNQSNSNNRNDERFWTLTRDKESGRGEAIIRFLPPKSTDAEALPYAKFYSHFFKGDTGKWLVVDACPRTEGKACPICERNMKLYQEGKKDRYNYRKARTNYLFNILVVNDTACPENNGKVFLFKTGPVIYNMITESMAAEFDDEAAVPFDIDSGNNFILRSRTDTSRSSGMITYDKSKFETKLTSIANSDAELEKIFNSMYDLNEVVQDMLNQYSPEELERKCKDAYLEDDPGSLTYSQPTNEDVSFAKQIAKFDQSAGTMDNLPWDEPEETSKKPERIKQAKEAPSKNNDDDDDDALDYFRSLS